MHTVVDLTYLSVSKLSVQASLDAAPRCLALTCPASVSLYDQRSSYINLSPHSHPIRHKVPALAPRMHMVASTTYPRVYCDREGSTGRVGRSLLSLSVDAEPQNGGPLLMRPSAAIGQLSGGWKEGKPDQISPPKEDSSCDIGRPNSRSSARPIEVIHTMTGRCVDAAACHVLAVHAA